MKTYLFSDGSYTLDRSKLDGLFNRGKRFRVINSGTEDVKSDSFTYNGITYDSISGAQQSFKDECDINLIVKRANAGTNVPTHMLRDSGIYGDFSSVPDFTEAMNILNKAHEQFGNLSARVRARFDNDPAKFLEFVQNKDSNGAEIIELGLGDLITPSPIPEDRQAILDNTEALRALAKSNSKKFKSDEPG